LTAGGWRPTVGERAQRLRSGGPFPPGLPRPRVRTTQNGGQDALLHGPLTLTRFTYLDEPWCAIDLAGGPEFARMAARPLLGSDAVVLCVAPDPDEAVLAAPYLRAIEASGTPCMIFIRAAPAT
jgi:hypothetical protein